MGFSLFARRYLGYHESCVHLARKYAPDEHNSYCSLFLLVLRCFTSQGSLLADVTPRITVQNCRVSPFGDFRIKGYKPPPRNFSQVSRVLHSRPRPRHPPCTLMSLVRRPIYHNHYLHFDTHHTWKCDGSSITFAYSYVKECVSLETKEPPQGAVLSRFTTRGPYGLSAPEKLVFFRFVDT